MYRRIVLSLLSLLLVAVAGWCGAPPVHAIPNLVAPTCTTCGQIKGQITSSVTGEGIPGASLVLFPHNPSSPQLNTLSNPGGVYEVDNVPPDTYEWMVSAQGYKTICSTGFSISSGTCSSTSGTPIVMPVGPPNTPSTVVHVDFVMPVGPPT